jgi:hypothetical protein
MRYPLRRVVARRSIADGASSTDDDRRMPEQANASAGIFVAVLRALDRGALLG